MPARWSFVSLRQGRLFAAAGRQPSWVVKGAAIAAAMVMVAVLALLVLPAAVVFGAVLLIGAGMAALRRSLIRLLPDRQGRRNVRVLAPRDDLP